MKLWDRSELGGFLESQPRERVHSNPSVFQRLQAESSTDCPCVAAVGDVFQVFAKVAAAP
jgi:hypothetical protein